jgi:cytochrome P450
MVEQLEPRIRAVANELLDAVSGQDHIDAVEALTYPLPVIMIAEILGVPPEDRADFKRWSDVVVSTLGTGLGEEAREPAEETIREFQEYLGRLIEDRRANPRNDLTSALVAAEEEGSKLTYAELIQMLILLLVAGNETTTNLIGNAILEFIAHPGELEKLRANPALLPTAIEEVLRFSSPVQATVRRAMRDTTLRGHDIAEGQQCVVWLASANRDADHFPDPDTFDITRTPNRHVGFGLGIHFCLGAPLARLEARIAVETFLNRYKSFARTDDSLLPRVPTFIMHGVRELPLVVTETRT